MLRFLVSATAVVLAAACAGAPPAGSATPTASFAGQTVTSSDGNAALEIPVGALPAGVSASDIKIEPSDLVDKLDGSPLIAAYRLEPDGTVFQAPVTVSIAALPGSDVFPELAVLNADQAEFLNTDSKYDMDSGTFVVSAPLTHFSTVVAYRGNVRAELTDPGDRVVGVPFEMKLTLSRTYPNHLVDFDTADPDAVARMASVFSQTLANAETYGPMTFQSGLLGAFGGVITPGGANWPEAPVTVEDEPATFSGIFKCSSSGDGYFIYSAHALQSWRGVLVHFITIRPDQKNIVSIGIYSHHFKCRAGATPSPTASPSAAASATPEVLESLPVSNISGICFNLVDGSPPTLIFTLYSYDLPVDHMIITMDGVNGGQPTSLNFNTSVDGWKDVPLEVTGAGAGKIKSVIFVQPDGTQLDVTKPFTTVLGTDTVDLNTVGGTGPICPS